MSALRNVAIFVSNQKTHDTYLSKSYPVADFDGNGRMELYRTPVYWLYIDGTDDGGSRVRKQWKALRFMPYWNPPRRPDRRYRTLGWINSGKWRVSRKAVAHYDPRYGTHNRYSPYSGAIQIDGAFLIHAGPVSLDDHGWGAAGCVEIIGDFDRFKGDVRDLSGSTKADASDAILELVAARKLTVEIEEARPPDFRSGLDREVDIR